MINLVTNEEAQELTRLCGNNPFGLRISSAHQSYGTAFQFCEFWLQSGADGAHAAVSRVDGHITVCGVSPDADELSAFLQAVGGSDIFAPGFLTLPLPFVRRAGGAVMCFKPQNKFLQQSVKLDTSPRLEEIYRILFESGQSEAVGEHDAWYADVSHRIRHGYARAVLLCESETPAACAMAVAESASAALIGGVAVLPEYRGRGLGKSVVSGLCGILHNEKKDICLCCDDSLTGFYSKLGFETNGSWAVWDNNIR